MTEIKLETACCNGVQRVYTHHGQSLGCEMECAVFLPSKAKEKAVPVVIYLSGLTCTWENATTKAGAQYHAEKLGLALVFPDTSPRGEQVPDNEAYDLGQGAGFYLNATQAPWNSHFHMENYIVQDIPSMLAETELPLRLDNFALTGHSMGGHGALTLALKNPQKFTSVSAFAPIVNPVSVPWGQKAFSAYLGDDKSLWENYDASFLVERLGYHDSILIDQGLADAFFGAQLQPEVFAKACEAKGVSLELGLHDGYDHSYYFIASFMEKHLRFHAERLIA